MAAVAKPKKVKAGPVEIHIDKHMEAFELHLKGLVHRNMKRVMDRTIFVLAEKMGALIRRGYLSATYKRKKGTLQAYADPAEGKLTWSGSPLVRSRTLAENVVREKRSPGNHDLMIDPRATYQSGDPHDKNRGLKVAQVGDWMEHGVSYIVQATVAMMAYLKRLREGGGKAAGGGGGAGASKESGKGVKTGKAFYVTIKPKPVWGPVHAKVRQAIHDHARALNFWMKKEHIERVPGVPGGMIKVRKSPPKK